jgi:hypothetical protein
MRKLNIFEQTLMERVAVEHTIVKFHLPYLLVRKVWITGFGMYIYFSYSEIPNNLPMIDQKDTFNSYIGASINIELKSLQYGLGHSVATTKEGLIGFIEIITYAEPWDGDTTDFVLIDE